MDEQELNEEDHGRLQKWGYKPTASADKPWIRGGLYLLNLSDNQSDYWFISENWNELLKERAAYERIKWTYTAQTFPGAMVAMGIVESKIEAGKQRSTHRLRIAGKLERRLLVRSENLSPDNSDDERERSQRSQQSQENLSQDTSDFAQHETVTTSVWERSQWSQDDDFHTVTAVTAPFEESDKSGHNDQLASQANGEDLVTAVTAVTAQKSHSYTNGHRVPQFGDLPPDRACFVCKNTAWRYEGEHWICGHCNPLQASETAF